MSEGIRRITLPDNLTKKSDWDKVKELLTYQSFNSHSVIPMAPIDPCSFCAAIDQLPKPIKEKIIALVRLHT